MADFPTRCRDIQGEPTINPEFCAKRHKKARLGLADFALASTCMHCDLGAMAADALLRNVSITEEGKLQRLQRHREIGLRKALHSNSLRGGGIDGRIQKI